jgi:hypothetical protein
VSRVPLNPRAILVSFQHARGRFDERSGYLVDFLQTKGCFDLPRYLGAAREKSRSRPIIWFLVHGITSVFTLRSHRRANSPASDRDTA